ncbi:MAG: F0F1 ATP synthase subunit B [Enterobacterales bacterium]
MNINATIFGQIIAFIIFVSFCMKFIWPPLIDAINKRQKDIAKNISAAEDIKNKANLLQIKSINNLKNTKLQANIIINNAYSLKEEIIKKAKIEAQIEKNKIIYNAQLEINRKYSIARKELQNDISMLSIKCVKKIFKHSMNKIVNDDIIEKIVSKL